MGDNGRDKSMEDLEEIPEDAAYTVLDDDRREELDSMLDLKVVGIELEVWDEDEDEEEPDGEPALFDCDLFLDEGQALELYAAAVYPDPEGDPTKGVDPIFEVVGKLVDDELALLDYQQADDEGGLLLAFGRNEEVRMVVLANEWMVSEWEADEEEEDDEAGEA